MGWLLYIVAVPLVVTVLAAWAARVVARPRPYLDEPAARPPARGPWALRTAFGLIAVAIAATAGLTAWADPSLAFQPAVSLLYLGSALAAGAVTCYPTRQWPSARRLAAELVALVWAALALGTLPLALAIPACACGQPPGAPPPPTPLGLDARGWILLAATVAPLLMFLTATRLPEALARARPAWRTRR